MKLKWNEINDDDDDEDNESDNDKDDDDSIKFTIVEQKAFTLLSFLYNKMYSRIYK